MNLKRISLQGLVIILVVFGMSTALMSQGTERISATKPKSDSTLARMSEGFDSRYAKVLSAYVDDKGLVNYSSLKSNRDGLDKYLEQLAEVSEAEYESWSRNRKIAFWINAYNSITLRSIINNYPIKKSFLTGLVYPNNSIRQISGVWDKKTHKVLNRKLTLEDIEHKILREEFKEPRIHVALVCAALSCPALSNEPFSAEQLDAQFERQAKNFFGSNYGMQDNEDQLMVSKIFSWFASDFLWRYPDASSAEDAVREYIQEFSDLSSEKSSSLPIDYLDYDWSLNEKVK